jgi:hypothetical protein
MYTNYLASLLVAQFKLALVLAGVISFELVIGETRVARTGKWQRRGRPDIGPPAAAFDDGITKPSAANTGIRTAPLQTFGADQAPFVYTISSPGIYDSFFVHGRIQVNNDTGVVIQDVTVDMTAPPASASIYGILFNSANAHDNVVQFCKITVSNPIDQTEWVSAAVRGRGYDVYRCDISYTTDGVHATGKTGATEIRVASIRCSYLHDFVARFSASQGTTHDDCIQVFGGVTLIVFGNTLMGGVTSCIILNYGGSSTYAYGDVTIIWNWMHGYPSAGATLNIATASQPIPNLNVTNNRIDRNGFDSGQLTIQTPHRVPANFGAISGTINGTVSDWNYGSNCNKYMDDNSAARIQVG